MPDVEDKSNGAGAAEAAILSLSVEDESNWEETEKEAIVSLSEAAKKILPSHFAALLDKQKVSEYAFVYSHQKKN